MGKRLRGNECGKGICQRKDGLYSARLVTMAGKCKVKCFFSLPEAPNWRMTPRMRTSARMYVFRQI